MASGPITSWQIDGKKVEAVADFIFLGSKTTADGNCSHEIKRCLLLGRKAMTNLDSILKSRDVTYGCELDDKQDWALNNWCLWNVASEKTLESPLDSKEIKPVNPKGNQSSILIGRTDAEAEAPIFWLFDVKRQLIEKDPVAGEDWRQKEKEAAEVEMSGWHHWLNGLEFEQTPGDTEVCGSLLCSSPWGHKELDTTLWLKNNNKYVKQNKF